MQRDQNLRKLFRARLPIATIPKEFADRLTKTVLDEVHRLRQAQLSSAHRSGEQENALDLCNAPVVQESLPVKQATGAILLLLFVNVQLVLGLQGCAWPPYKALVAYTVSTPSAFTGTPTVNSQLPKAQAILLTRAARMAHLPPLRPVKPTLPIVVFTPIAPTITEKVTEKVPLPTQLITLARRGFKLREPPPFEQPSRTAITITVPQEQPSAPPAASTPTHEATDLPELVTTPTTSAPNVEATLPPTPPPTSIYTIFEPTLTSTVAPEENPLPTVTSEPTPTPTIFIHPWEPTVNSEPLPATTLPPVDTPTP